MPALAEIAQRARSAYVARIAGGAAVPWWTAVVVTANSARQAGRYEDEIRRRREQGTVPAGVHYAVVPDTNDRRIGSGGATINALRVLAEQLGADTAAGALESWWEQQRVFIIHSGGDSRRLPQYSLSGKLFSALPVKTPWGEVSTVFDEFLALSTAWAARLDCGLVVASGDVILTFEAGQLNWQRPGVCGVAISQPVETGSQHGVYVLGDQGRVYSFLQKPSASQVKAAGGLLADGNVALDTGLLRMDPSVAARLTDMGRSAGDLPVIDLYEHVSMALTGQWAPGPDDHPAYLRLADVLGGVPFSCSLVEGDFTHVGTTTAFRKLFTEENNFSNLYAAQQRMGAVTPAGVRSAGVIIDSVLSGGGELGSGAMVIECDLAVAVRAARGSIVHGVADLSAALEVPEDTVVHQVPIAMPDGRHGMVVRVYGVADDPKGSVAAGTATWMGRPMAEALVALGIDADAVWAGIPRSARTLWNAQLFPFGTLDEVWACARWMMGSGDSFGAADWVRKERLSLASSAQWADSQALADQRSRRMQSQWQLTAVSLANAGTDVRPLLAHAPGIRSLASAGRALYDEAKRLEELAPTDAASRYCQASLFLAQAGLDDLAGKAYEAAFRSVEVAVLQGDEGPGKLFAGSHAGWRQDEVSVSAPPRIDLGGGWSDTPPFCLDWGGTVLNIAVALNGAYPIRTTLRRLAEPVVRCIAGEGGQAEKVEYRSEEEIFAPSAPGDPFSIPRAALQIAGILSRERRLQASLEALGGGLEICTEVNLPMGSGLGTSSILSAAVLRGLADMLGVVLTEHQLSDLVMCLEQRMTTGGGWQDQAGGIFPGAKLIMSGPGVRQRLRVEPAGWSPERKAEFERRFILYYTGIRRVAKDLLRQVVGRYLAREVHAVQVLHSIKTLASEMAYSLREGEWDYLGRLIDRHWQLNQVLDPHTTNAPINAMLQEIRPLLAGAKLAGAGGGGFLMLLAKSEEAAMELRHRLASPSPILPGVLYEFEITNEGLRSQLAAAK